MDYQNQETVGVGPGRVWPEIISGNPALPFAVPALPGYPFERSTHSLFQHDAYWGTSLS